METRATKSTQKRTLKIFIHFLKVYPYNPSGTVRGIAGLCTHDGRHLALMPHPERAFLKWQWPYWPASMGQISSPSPQFSPWLKMFQNARVFCEQ